MTISTHTSGGNLSELKAERRGMYGNVEMAPRPAEGRGSYCYSLLENKADTVDIST